MTEELTLRTQADNLPALPIQEVKQYVDVIGDAINALKAKRSAAGHLNADKSIIDAMDSQIREYSAMKLRAEMEMGKRTAELEKNSGGDRRSEEFQKSEVRTFETKQSTLDELGIPKQRASEYERLARNETTVEAYIADRLAHDEVPTRSGAQKAIADSMPRPKSLEEEAKERVEEFNEKDVVTIQDAEQARRDRRFLDTQTSANVQQELGRLFNRIDLYLQDGTKESDCFTTFLNTANSLELNMTAKKITRVIDRCVALRDLIRAKLERMVKEDL